MFLNVNMGPAAQDFKIELIVIRALLHKFSKSYFRGFWIIWILYLYLFDTMAVNVNKGPAAQDFKIEIIMISASMHKIF